MKKLILTLALAFAGIFAANAQVWLGGSVGAQVKDGFAVSVAPEIGYSFEDSPISIATALNFILTGAEGNTYWGLIASPYVRFKLATIEKFNFFLDATGDFYIPNGGWRAGVQPGIAWNATEHWTAAARIGFLGYNKCPFLGAEGFILDFKSAIPSIGLYYNF